MLLKNVILICINGPQGTHAFVRTLESVVFKLVMLFHPSCLGSLHPANMLHWMLPQWVILLFPSWFHIVVETLY